MGSRPDERTPAEPNAGQGQFSEWGKHSDGRLLRPAGVGRDADCRLTQASYRRLAPVSNHPDVNRDPGARRPASEIGSGYEILKRSPARRPLRPFGEAGVSGAGRGQLGDVGASPTCSNLSFSGFGWPGQGERPRRRRHPARATTCGSTYISFNEGCSAGTRDVQIATGNLQHPLWLGRQRPAAAHHLCTCRHGAGQVRRANPHPLRKASPGGPLSQLRRRGQVDCQPCRRLRRQGVQQVRKKLRSTIPAAVDFRAPCLRVSSEGKRLASGVAPLADLYVYLSCRPRQAHREGNPIHSDGR